MLQTLRQTRPGPGTRRGPPLSVGGPAPGRNTLPGEALLPDMHVWPSVWFRDTHDNTFFSPFHQARGGVY